MSPVITSASSRGAVRRRLLAAGCALALAASLGACEISLKGGDQAESSGSSASSAAGSQQSDRAGEAPSANGSASAEASESVSAEPTSLPPLEGAPSDGSRPGARATITNAAWVETATAPDHDVTKPRNGQVVLDKDYQTVFIEGDVTTLSVNASYVDVVVDYAQNIVVNGTGVNVYVRDTEHVSFTTDYNHVLWAGSTPYIDDSGSYNEARDQAEVE